MTSNNAIILNKLSSQKKSKFRSKFKLTQKDRDYIVAKGLDTIREHTFQFLNSRIASDFPKNDGKQTEIKFAFAQRAVKRKKSYLLKIKKRGLNLWLC
jgi:hypothetical protein